MPSKVPQSIKEMVERALTKAGGVEYLTAQAHANPVAFLGLVGKVLPIQLANANANGAPIILEVHWAPAVANETLSVSHETIDAEPAANTIDANTNGITWRDETC